MMISKQIFLKFFISYFIILECDQVYESIRKPKKKSNPINIKDLVDQNVNVICHFDQIVISHPQTKNEIHTDFIDNFHDGHHFDRFNSIDTK